MMKNFKKLIQACKVRNNVFRPLRVLMFAAALPFLYGSPGCNSGGGTTSQLFEQAWSDFDKNYSYFIHKNIDWDAVKTQYQAQFQQELEPEAFAENLNAMLQVLHDWHVWVQKPGGDYLGYDGSIETNYTSTPRNRYAPKGYEQLGNGIIYHGIVGENGENIAYIRIDTLDTESFASISDQDIENLFAAYANASGMIIDIRANSGGNEENARKFAARFTDTTRLFGKVAYRNGPGHDDFDAPIEKTLEPGTGTHFNGPVACLIGQRVMSSGEWFTLMMKVCPRVTLMGDHTRGASGGPEVFSLANGIKYNISRWVAYTYDDVAFEDLGIEPQIKIASSESFDGEHDYVLERAIQHIKDGGIPPSTTTTIPSNTTTTIPAGTTTVPSSGAPVVTSLTVNPVSGNLSTVFKFTCEAEDTDGGFIVLYYWDYEAMPGLPGEETYSLSGSELGEGAHVVSVWVEDDEGKLSAKKSITVTVTK